MAFNSYSYLLLLIPAVLLFWLLPAAWRRSYLVLVSVLYYATWNPVHLILPFILVGGVGACARRMGSQVQDARRWLRLGIGFALALLALFKYSGFLLANVKTLVAAAGVRPWESAFSLALPLGISFYTFETVSFLLDTYQGRVKKAGWLDLSVFVMFWPHLMAGPIVRFRELIPQFAARRNFDLQQFMRGLDRLLLGLVQKNLLANNLGAMADAGFLPQAALANSTVDNWFLACAFGLQIYFDFASYSNMAIGTALLMGIQLPENFRFPYHAATPPDFWARWHMTLSRWIRDYLFFPINARYGGAPLPLYASLLGTMALVGLWHGAGWGFVLWGVLQGLYLVLYRIWERAVTGRPAWQSSRLAAWLWRGFTLAAVLLAWIPFRAPSLEQAGAMLWRMCGGFRWHISYNANSYLLVLLIAAFCVCEPWLAGLWEDGERKLSTGGRGGRWTQLGARPAIYAVALLLFLIFDDRDMQFIYFQF